MKIGIDVRELAGEKAGKGWYVYRLLEQLAALDARNEYVLYAREGFDVPRPRASRVVLVDRGGFSWHRAVAKRLRADGVELFFAPLSLIIPALTALPTVLVIYDLTALTVSGKHTWKSRLIEKLLTGRALKKSRRILAISEATRRDILKLFPRAAGKVVVTPLGVDGIFRVLEEEPCRPVWERYGLKTGYLLFVGTLEPRKNVANLIEAYGRLEDGLRDKHPLVIVGKKGWFYGEIFRKVRELSLEERVRFLGYLPEEELPAIYNGAGVFLYPSWYEGFGLPAPCRKWPGKRRFWLNRVTWKN